jgi:hypothetical protein
MFHGPHTLVARQRQTDSEVEQSKEKNSGGLRDLIRETRSPRW